jgi:hypothetical protein
VSAPEPKPGKISDLIRMAETLLIGGAGAATLGLAGVPAGWLSGAIVAVSIAALAGRPVRLPDPLARVTFVIMGISLGAAVTPETVAGMAIWPLSLAVLGVGMVALTASVAFYLSYVHGWDRASALFGSFPGALATTLVLAIENGADVRAVAVVQTVRVAALAVLLPAGLTAFGFAGTPFTGAGAGAAIEPGPLALLVGVATAAALAAHWLRFPGGLMFGAMLASALLHGTGWVHVTLPPWLSTGAFVVLGSLTGTRFANTDVRLLRHLAGAALGALMVASVVAFGFAFLSSWLLQLNTGATVIAYAPGALDAMMILALALHLDPAFIGAHHVARFTLVLLSMPLLVRIVRGGRKAEASAATKVDVDQSRD